MCLSCLHFVDILMRYSFLDLMLLFLLWILAMCYFGSTVSVYSQMLLSVLWTLSKLSYSWPYLTKKVYCLYNLEESGNVLLGITEFEFGDCSRLVYILWTCTVSYQQFVLHFTIILCKSLVALTSVTVSASAVVFYILIRGHYLT